MVEATRPPSVALPAAAALLCLAGFGLVVVAVRAGWAEAFDVAGLKLWRTDSDPDRTVGPRMLAPTVRTVTFAGSAAGMVLVSSAAYFALRRRGRADLGWLVLIAAAGSWALNELLKLALDRPRPDVVPHLLAVESLSLPSGHAMVTSATLLMVTLAASKVAVSQRRLVAIAAAALLATLLIGWTRVFLGVHYPTDVLGGWLAGCGWTLVVWTIARGGQKRNFTTEKNQRK